MGATCGADVGCCKGNINTEEIVAVGGGSGAKTAEKDHMGRKSSGASGSMLRPRQDSITNGGYNSTTFI